MDVSGSMDDSKKFLARIFFWLLYRFVQSKYEHAELVFITHHATAREVNEDEFFHTMESGGTVVSSAYELALEIDRHPLPARRSGTSTPSTSPTATTGRTTTAWWWCGRRSCWPAATCSATARSTRPRASTSPSGRPGNGAPCSTCSSRSQEELLEHRIREDRHARGRLSAVPRADDAGEGERSASSAGGHSRLDDRRVWSVGPADPGGRRVLRADALPGRLPALQLRADDRHARVPHALPLRALELRQDLRHPEDAEAFRAARAWPTRWW